MHRAVLTSEDGKGKEKHHTAAWCPLHGAVSVSPGWQGEHWSGRHSMDASAGSPHFDHIDHSLPSQTSSVNVLCPALSSQSVSLQKPLP